MRRIVVTVIAAAVIGSVCGTARAEYPYDGYGSNYAPNYGYQVNNYYGGWSPPSYYLGSAETFDQAAARIRAAHSRYRYFTHPLSQHNSPPTQADYFGWGWGY